MPRPRKKRIVSSCPYINAFVPKVGTITGVVTVTMEEFETLRLSDFEGLDQERAAEMMEVSRHTYGRMLARARTVVAEALVSGKELRIEGGDFEFRGRGRCHRHGRRCQAGMEEFFECNVKEDSDDSSQ